MSAPVIAPAAPPGPTRRDAIRRAAILRKQYDGGDNQLQGWAVHIRGGRVSLP